jgi:hypothetical protein
MMNRAQHFPPSANGRAEEDRAGVLRSSRAIVGAVTDRTPAGPMVRREPFPRGQAHEQVTFAASDLAC